jgi:scyllo-inositol 2-dehydrogenase (NADP+)
MKPTRLGIIGPGLIWQFKHRPVLDRLRGDFAVTALCASSDQHRAEAARDYPGVPFVTDLNAFLRRDDVDAVVVLTPIPLNGPVSLAALRAGKDVLVEKPMAHKLEDGQALVETAGRLGRRLWVLEQDAYAQRWRQVRDVIQSGEIGEPVVYDQVVHWPLDDGRYTRGGYGNTAWRIQPDFPLGILFDGGHHQIAVLSTLFGPASWVFASGVSLRPTFGDYDHVLMQFGHAGKLRGTLSYSSLLGSSRNYFHIRGTQGSVTVENDRLIVSRDDSATRTLELPAEDVHEQMWRALAQSIDQNREPAYPKEYALRDLAILFGVEQAIKTGAKVELD